jgi:hypothetical protein
MIDDARRARLLPLTRRIWPDAESIEIVNGLRGCDPCTAFVRLDGSEVVLDIAGNEYSSDALEAAINVLAQSPSEDRDLTALQTAYAEIKKVGLTVKDLDPTQSLFENASRLGISQTTVGAILETVAPPKAPKEAPRWVISLAAHWQREAGRDMRTEPHAPLREKDVRTPPDRKPYTYKNPRVEVTKDDERAAAYYQERPEELALHFARLRYQAEDKLRKLHMKHAQEILKASEDL